MKFTMAMQHNWLLKKLNKKTWQIEEEFIWYINYKDKKEYVVVPKWFQTDLWSIPKFMRWFIDYTYISYILHDYLYEQWIISLVDTDIKLTATKTHADIILREALKVEWMWFIRRWIVFLWVFLFWRIFYKK